MHFKDGRIDWDACYHISHERYDMAPEIQLRENDVLVTKDGSIGKVAYVDCLPDRASLNSHLLVIRPLHGEYEGRFLFHLLGSETFHYYILNEQKGTTFFGITQESVENFPVLIPPLEEQRSIADFLDRETEKIDALVSRKERLIEVLLEKRAALITHAVTKGLDSDVPLKDSGVEWLSELPAHWDAKQLKRLWKRCDYGVSEDLSVTGEIRVLTMGHIQDGEVVLPDEGSLEELPEEFILDQNDLLFNRTNSRDLVAKVGIFRGDRSDRVSFASYLVRLTASEDVSPEYLNYLLNSSVVLSKARSMALLSVNQANLNPTKYGQLSVPIPPRAEQEDIVAVLTEESAKLNALIQRIREGIDCVKEFRTALISAVVTGKIDVREEIA
jgi:type I restriction enzyme, S subunit